MSNERWERKKNRDRNTFGETMFSVEFLCTLCCFSRIQTHDRQFTHRILAKRLPFLWRTICFLISASPYIFLKLENETDTHRSRTIACSTLNTPFRGCRSQHTEFATRQSVTAMFTVASTSGAKYSQLETENKCSAKHDEKFSIIENLTTLRVSFAKEMNFVLNFGYKCFQNTMKCLSVSKQTRFASIALTL